MLTHEEQQKVISELLAKKQNALCADCKAKYPCWASLDFGVFVCYNCSGVHRALGPTVTRIKSTKLDTWKREWLDLMRVGNTVLNQHWEHSLPPNEKPSASSSDDEMRREFIRNKYIEKLYAKPDSKPPTNCNIQPESTKPKQLPKSDIAVPMSKHPPKPPTQKKNAFVAFDDMFPSCTKPKPAPVMKKEASNLISFAEDKKEEGEKAKKYSVEQFRSVGGAASQPVQQKRGHSAYPKESFDCFDSLLSKKSSGSTKKHHNNFMEAGPSSNQPTHSTHSFMTCDPFSLPFDIPQLHSHPSSHSSHSQPATNQPNNSHFVTMNINMNVYPSVMNVNFPPGNPTSQNNSSINSHNPNHHQYNHQQFATVGGGGSSSNPFSHNQQQQQGKPGTHFNPHHNITLQPKIAHKMSKKASMNEPPKSWVDEWK